MKCSSKATRANTWEQVFSVRPDDNRGVNEPTPKVMGHATFMQE